MYVYLHFIPYIMTLFRLLRSRSLNMKYIRLILYNFYLYVSNTPIAW